MNIRRTLIGTGVDIGEPEYKGSNSGVVGVRIVDVDDPEKVTLGTGASLSLQLSTSPVVPE